MKHHIKPLFFIFLFYIAQANSTDSIMLSTRQQCDLELIINGGFSPLDGFMNQTDYEQVVQNMRLANGTVWPIPIVLDVPEHVAKKTNVGSTLKLCAADGTILATMQITDIWKPDKVQEALLVYGTTDTYHAGVCHLLEQTHDYCLGGPILNSFFPQHYDFPALRKTPTQLKQYFKEQGIKKVIGFQTRNPTHRAHQEITQRAADQIGGHLLIHPSVGQTKPGDIDYVTRIRCYKKLLPHYPGNTVTLSLLPLAMRMAGPREALWHAIIRKNYGCTHFIVGRDHSGPGKDKNGNDFYGPYDAQKLVRQYEKEIGITMVPFQEMVYVLEQDCYMPRNEVSEEFTILQISGTQLRQMLREGKDIPLWFSYPEIVLELRKNYKKRSEQGFTIFITGLPASGKSTLAQVLAIRLSGLQNRPITVFDGDIIRKNLSKGLGFSKEDRSINVQRVGFVAKEITKHGGIAICSLIAPYAQDRATNRTRITQHGGYIEVHVATPLDVCEAKDPKGMYAKAREGIIKNFTGIDDPYEKPNNPEVTVNTTHMSVEEEVEKVINHLIQNGYILSSNKNGESTWKKISYRTLDF